MAKQCVNRSIDRANVLPSGPAGAALAAGDLVYLDSSGNWQLAVSVALGSTSRTDAIGVITETAVLQYETVSPVKCADIEGFSGLVIGAKQFLSATGTTGNTITASEPTTTVRQVIGFAASATKLRVEVGAAAGADLDVGGDMYVDSITATGAATLPGATTIGGSAVVALATITSVSANALTVGPAGTTNPSFNVDASTGSAATGLNVKSAAAAGGLAVSVVSSGDNENLTVDAKGTGTISIGSVSSGAITLARATAVTGAITGTSTSASALAVGANGATNPVLKVNANTGSVASGLEITGAASGSGVAVAAIGGTNEALILDGKGSGTISLNATGTGNILAKRKIVMTDAKDIDTGTTTGTLLASAVSQKLGFWGKHPVIQQASSAQGIVTTSVTTTATTTNLKTTVAAALALLTRIRLDLVTTGIIKGAA